MNKKIKITSLIAAIIILILIGYVILKLTKSNEEHWITDNEFLYEKAIDYLEKEQTEKNEVQNLPNYRVFTDYKKFGITEQDNKKYVYMWILMETFYLEDNELKTDEGSSMAYKFIVENDEIISYEIPKDGDYYIDSIKEMFPNSIVNDVINCEIDDAKLNSKVEEYYSSITNNLPQTEFERSPENVTIEVDSETISSTSVSITITDNNKHCYGWGVEFKVQKKVNDEWQDLDYISDEIGWIAIAYVPNKDNQIKEKLDIEQYYGKLSSGVYRIVKPVYDNGYVYIYSNEFKIK